MKDLLKIVLILNVLTGFAQAADMGRLEYWVDSVSKRVTFFTKPEVKIGLYENAQVEEAWGNLSIELRYYYYFNENDPDLVKLQKKFPGYEFSRAEIQKDEIEDHFALTVLPINMKIDAIDTYDAGRFGITRSIYLNKSDFRKLVDRHQAGLPLLKWGQNFRYVTYLKPEVVLTVSKDYCVTIFSKSYRAIDVLTQHILKLEAFRKPTLEKRWSEIQLSTFKECVFLEKEPIETSFKEMLEKVVAKNGAPKALQFFSEQNLRPVVQNLVLNLGTQTVEVQ